MLINGVVTSQLVIIKSLVKVPHLAEVIGHGEHNFNNSGVVSGQIHLSGVQRLLIEGYRLLVLTLLVQLIGAIEYEFRRFQGFFLRQFLR